MSHVQQQRPSFLAEKSWTVTILEQRHASLPQELLQADGLLALEDGRRNLRRDAFLVSDAELRQGKARVLRMTVRIRAIFPLQHENFG